MPNRPVPSPADRFQNAEDMINTVKLTFISEYASFERMARTDRMPQPF